MEEETEGILKSLLVLEALQQDTGSSKLHSEITATAIAMLRRPLVSEQFEKELKTENPENPENPKKNMSKKSSN